MESQQYLQTCLYNLLGNIRYEINRIANATTGTYDRQLADLHKSLGCCEAYAKALDLPSVASFVVQLNSAIFEHTKTINELSPYLQGCSKEHIQSLYKAAKDAMEEVMSP